MLTLYKPTKFKRALLVQEPKVHLSAEIEAPPNSFRDVQVMIPDSPEVHFDLLSHQTFIVHSEGSLHDDNLQTFALEELGGNRGAYNTAPFTRGANISFRLTPDQILVGLVDEKFAICGLIIQFVEWKG